MTTQRTFTLLIGAPGSGKSYYARQLRSPQCLVLDRSDYLVSMSGVRKYYRPIRAIANAMLDTALIEIIYSSGLSCAIMDWGKTRKERENLLLMAKDAGMWTRLIYLDTSPEVCLARIRADKARSNTTRWSLLIAHWVRDFEPVDESEADELVIVRPGDAPAR